MQYKDIGELQAFPQDVLIIQDEILRRLETSLKSLDDDDDRNDAPAEPQEAVARDVFETAREIAPLAVDVLIEGETGAGKDVMARELHRLSRRSGKFVAINCAAIPENIVESELFGYEAGAFTGAVRAREGKLEAADKGTLYLDEIDSMPLVSQAKLLRALQERGAERLGSNRFYNVDFRVIASTKVSLSALVAQEKFRRDLYFRLNVVKLRLPSLRTSPSRIASLFLEFLDEACKRHRRPMPGVSRALHARLIAYPWPGNIRELRTAAERHALGLHPFDEDAKSALTPPAENVPESPLAADDASMSLRDRMRAYEREVISSTLRMCGGSVPKASKLLHVPANTLYYRIKVLGIQADLVAF